MYSDLSSGAGVRGRNRNVVGKTALRKRLTGKIGLRERLCLCTRLSSAEYIYFFRVNIYMVLG